MKWFKLKRCLQPWAVALVVLMSLHVATAQRQGPSPPPLATDIGADKGSPNDQRGPLTTFEEEMRAKRAIKLAEREHEDNLKRARELSDLGQQLKSAISRRSFLDREDNRKLDRLEKLTKKIRGEAGGEDDDVKIEDAPNNIASAVTKIAEEADLLSKDVQKTPRQVVSASVIDRSNVLLQLIRILRGFSRPA